MCRLIRIAPVLFAVVIAVQSSSAGQSVENAKLLFESGDLEGAREILESALQSDPGNHEAHCYLGRIALQEGNLEGAIDALERSVELDPANSGYRTWLGQAYLSKLQGAPLFEKGVLAGRVLEQLTKAIEIDPSNVRARVLLAGYYLNAPPIAGGSKSKALEQAEEIRRYDQVEADALLAGVHVQNGEYESAIEKYERCIESRPENGEYIYRLAMVHRHLEDFDRSFELFEQVLEVDPDATAALYQIGRTAVFSRTRLDRGIECLQSYLERDLRPGHPGYDAAHWRLGMLYEFKGDPGAARKEYEAALRINPEEEKYRESLASLDSK